MCMCHLVVSAVPDLFDFSIHYLSFIIISLITLLFLLPDTFNFHDVVDKYPAHFRWGPWHPGRERASHKIGIFVNLISKVFMWWKSWREFKNYDESSRRRLIENQDTIDEVTARIQELQNEVNCMNDSRDFKDAESVRNGLSHVPSQPALFPPYRDPGGLLSRNDKPPDIWDTHGISGNVFCKSTGVFFITLSITIQSLDF